MTSTKASASSSFVVDIISLVPELWPTWLAPHSGLVGRAFERGLATLRVNPLRNFGKGVHRQVDDAPYGGGAGMVLGVDALHAAIAASRARTAGPVILLGPRGVPLSQPLAQKLAQGPGMILVCGRFEGVDERVRQYVDQEVSVGDVVLTAGDPAALCLIDATVRLLTDVVGNPRSLEDESFAQGCLEYPQYTRPPSFDGQDVPKVLLSGDHRAIDAWRRKEARELTERLRPDLIDKVPVP